MNLTDIAQYRLVNQQLAGTSFKHAHEMVSWFGAMQAQEYAQTKWGIGLRLPHLKEDDIEQAFTDGKILRTHLLRPTWHAVVAEDIRWMLKLTAPRVHAASAYMFRQLELETSLFNRCNKLIEKTLEGGKHFTRNALNEVFEKNKIIASGHRLSYIMMNAELEGLICSGARAGNQFTYALLDERVPAVAPKSEDESLAELAKRYFSSRGPATAKDFSTWSGLTLTSCKKGIVLIMDGLNEEKIAGEVYYFMGDPSMHPGTSQHLRLLPIYDEYIMGYKDRSAIFVHKNNLEPFSYTFDNTIVLDGQVVGTWKRAIGKKQIDLEYEFFKAPGTKQLKAFKQQLKQFETFTGLKVLSV